MQTQQTKTQTTTIKTKKIQKNKIFEDNIDEVKLHKLIKWLTENSTLISRMIKYIYQKNTVTFDEFKKGVQYTRLDQRFQHNIDNARSLKSNYGKIWTCEKNIITINPNIKNFIKNKKLIKEDI